MNTVFCNNHLCGKEYHESFMKCPFCGAENPSFKAPDLKEGTSTCHKRDRNKDIIHGTIRILICIVIALITIVLWNILTVNIGISGVLIKFIGATIAISAGISLNLILKKIYLRNKKKTR